MNTQPFIRLFAMLVVTVALSTPTAIYAKDKKRDDAPHPPQGCKLNFRPKIVRYENEIAVSTIQGSTDYRGYTWYNDGFLSTTTTTGIAPILIADVFSSSSDEDPAGARMVGGKDINLIRTKNIPLSRASDNVEDNGIFPKNSPQNDDQWYTEAKAALVKECRNYIVDHYENEIISIDGDRVMLSHHRCGEPRIQDFKSNRVLYIDVLQFDPVYEQFSKEQIAQKMCATLNQLCLPSAESPAELAWVAQMNAELGCLD